jgi:hypothetical protein
MTRYKQAFQEMVGKNKELFEKFKEVHDKYVLEPEKWKAKFDELGRPIVRIIWDAENRLCGKMEGSGRGQYSAGLAEKFKGEIKAYLSLIDMVGVSVE